MTKPRKRASRSVTAAAIRVLDERVRKCERALGFEKRRVGFDTTAVVGDRVEQDDDDPEIEEMP